MKSKNLLIVLGFILLLLGFWWFQIRPANIRKACNQELEDRYKGQEVDVDEANNRYRICLTENGLKPKDLLK